MCCTPPILLLCSSLDIAEARAGAHPLLLTGAHPLFFCAQPAGAAWSASCAVPFARVGRACRMFDGKKRMVPWSGKWPVTIGIFATVALSFSSEAWPG